LTKRIEELPENPFMADQKGIRLSLAGAQEKLSVSLKDNKIRISMNGAPSAHILKNPIKNPSEMKVRFRLKIPGASTGHWAHRIESFLLKAGSLWFKECHKHAHCLF